MMTTVERDRGTRLTMNVRFYLGLGAPGVRRRFPGLAVRAAPGYSPELVRDLCSLYRGESPPAGGLAERINFRCAKLTPAGSPRSFFFKEFPRQHVLHDLERWLRCSRVDRAWRAGHLLPRLGLLTPRPVGSAQARAADGTVTEYLATDWLDGAAPLPDFLKRDGGGQRLALLREFAEAMRRWHACGIYLRDLVKNVLVTVSGGSRAHWLTDLDGLHPLRRVTRRRLLHQMRQLAYWSGPLRPEEAGAVCSAYLGRDTGTVAQAVLHALLAPGRPAPP